MLGGVIAVVIKGGGLNSYNVNGSSCHIGDSDSVLCSVALD